jgi:hypothetical protein
VAPNSVVTRRRLRGCCAIAVAGVLVLMLLAACGGSARRSAPTLPPRAVAATVSTVGTTGQGWYGDQPTLSPAVVGGPRFGVRWSAHMNGQIYAPLVQAGQTVIAATENDEVRGIRLDDGATLWSDQLGSPWPTSTLGCRDIAPDVGVTGRPVLSRNGQTVYLATKTDLNGNSAHPVVYLHALSVATGRERAHWPVEIEGAADNDPSVQFDPLDQLNRPALLMLDGVVYIAFGSLCDGTYARGWVAGVSTATARLTTLWTSEAHVTDTVRPLGSIWESGGELVSDGPRQIVFATGNGPTPSPGSDSSRPVALGQSIVDLTVGPNGVLRESDFFTPHAGPALNLNDRDLGSGAPTVLPPVFGTQRDPRVILQGGKGGTLYLLDAARLGGRATAVDDVLSDSGPYGPIYSQPAAYPGQGGYAYVVTTGPLIALRPQSVGGIPHLAAGGRSLVNFGFSSSSAVVTSDGTAPGTALVWAVQSPTVDGSDADLVAFDAVPNNGVLTRVFSAPIGTAAKFGRPLVADGNVLVGTRDGTVLDFAPTSRDVATPALTASGSPLQLTAAVGGQSHATFSLTNPSTSAVTVIGVSDPAGPFSVTGPSPGAKVPAHATITVRATFRPSAIATSSSSVSYITSSGSTAIHFDGNGTPGASPSPLTIGDPSAGGWTFNGSAVPVADHTQLNPNLPFEIGDVVYPTPVSSRGITATFTTSIGGGTGGNGLTFALLDTRLTSATSLGGRGDGQGFGGLRGVAVAFSTFRASLSDPSNNFVGITDGYSDKRMTYAATTTAIPNLRLEPLRWRVTTDSADHLTVTADNQTVLTATAPLPNTVYLAFTAATGSNTDTHVISAVHITASTP